STVVLTLLELRDHLQSRGVEFALAGKRTLIEQWRRQRGLVSDGHDGRPALRLFSTLEDAVDAVAAAPRQGGGGASCVRARCGSGSRRRSSPEAVPADDGEAREDAVALIRGADAGEIDQSPVASVAPDEREEPAALQDAIAVEVGPVGPLAP